MKLTKEKLYKLIMEQMKAFYQAPRSMKKRLMADPNVDKATAMKLYRMLDSEDEDTIAAAVELMAALGIGEYGKDDEDITVMNTPETDKVKDEKQFYYGDSKRMIKQRRSDVDIGQFLGTKPHQKFSLDLLVKIYFDEFKKRLPKEVMYNEEERGSNEEQRRLANLMEDIISSFFDDTEEAYEDMGADNFYGFSRYENVLADNMIIYYDNIVYKRNNPIDKRLM